MEYRLCYRYHILGGRNNSSSIGVLSLLNIYPVDCESQPRLVSPGNWVCRNRMVRCQASSAAGASYASGRSFSKNQCFVPGYVWNVPSSPLVVRRTFSRSCTTPGGSHCARLGKGPGGAAM